MRSPRAAVVLAAVALAAPGQAQAQGGLAPPPAVLDFEAFEPGMIDERAFPGVTLSSSCGGSDGRAAAFALEPLPCARVVAPGHASRRALEFSGGRLDAAFSAPQRTVSLWVSAGTGQSGRVLVQALSAGVVVHEVAIANAGAFGQAATVQGAGITAVRVSCDADVYYFCGTVAIDDLSYSPVEQPDTAILSATDGTFVFVGNQPDLGFVCTVDGALAPCRAPFTAGPLAPGAHAFTAAVRDRYGNLDTSPATFTWTVAGPPPPPLPTPAPAPPDADGDAVADAADNCPGVANANQADADGDGVGDLCEVAAPGTLEPVAGERVSVEVLSGEVFIKLPPTALRAFKQESGFVPLKGRASVPVGSTVDTRRGAVAVSSAENARGTRRSARLSAGIFLIRQRRARTGSSARVATDLVLQSPPGAEAACARTTRSGPIKGRSRNTIRSLTAATAKGLFRVVGGAAITTAPDATWVTRDRCDGTRTEVGRGRVAVLDRSTRETVRVPAGRSYLVKARLFAARRATR